MSSQIDIADGLASAPSSGGVVCVVACREACFPTHSLFRLLVPFHNLRTTWSPRKPRSVCDILPAVSFSSLDTIQYRTAMYPLEVLPASNVPSHLKRYVFPMCCFGWVCRRAITTLPKSSYAFFGVLFSAYGPLYTSVAQSTTPFC
jgi:hypothetical protein